MKTKNLFVLPALIAVLNLIPSGRVAAQTFTTLHSFTAFYACANLEGAGPNGLVLSGNTLYGTANSGGLSGICPEVGAGTVFSVNTDGGFTTLRTFASRGPEYLDGAYPTAALILSGNTLYGTAYDGGTSGNGTLFRINTDRSGFTVLHSFTGGSDGANPRAGLISSGNTLYGTTQFGGSGGNGTVFAISTNGTGYTNLYSFTALSPRDRLMPSTNSDGANPQAGLILSGNTLYGTASQGGSSDNGTVFAVNTDGTGFTNLHSFTATADFIYTNSDGASPRAGLVLSGNTLYGTAVSGSVSGYGTVFAVNTDGSGFTNLHTFTAAPYPYTNSDGANPYAGLILSGDTLYGTALSGGNSSYGTVFAVNTNGTGFTNLHSFTARVVDGNGYYTNSDGAYPTAALILSGDTLYGTAAEGGRAGHGTVFSLSFRPQLTITSSGTNVILTWPTNVAGFDYTGYTLQSTTNLASPVVWSTNSPAPVVIGDQNTVTNPIIGAQKFYRLIQ
jgi:uncharacterized repeat protein (TIGR03803 family)